MITLFLFTTQLAYLILKLEIGEIFRELLTQSSVAQRLQYSSSVAKYLFFETKNLFAVIFCFDSPLLL